MDIVGGATRVITKAADATAATAGALSGAAINGVVGSVQGAASGIRNGVNTGSRSTPAAALTLGVIGAAGLVEWPVLLAVGGTALVVHQLGSRSDGQAALAEPTPLRAASGNGGRKAAPRKATSTARKSTPRKATTARRRSSTRKS